MKRSAHVSWPYLVRWYCGACGEIKLVDRSDERPSWRMKPPRLYCWSCGRRQPHWFETAEAATGAAPVWALEEASDEDI